MIHPSQGVYIYSSHNQMPSLFFSWLNNNSLAASKLTLMDALGPVSVPHDSKYVPIIDKHVRGKVFEEVLSVAHLTGDGQLSLINPQGVDLQRYVAQLDTYVSKCEAKLMRTAWSRLSPEEKQQLQHELSLSGRELPSYSLHWETIKEFLRSCGQTDELCDLEMVEKERDQATAYREQAIALQEDINCRSTECSSESSRVSLSSEGSLDSVATASLSLSHLSTGTQQSLMMKVMMSSCVSIIIYIY